MTMLLLLFIYVEKGAHTIENAIQYVEYYTLGSDELQRLCDERCKKTIV